MPSYRDTVSTQYFDDSKTIVKRIKTIILLIVYYTFIPSLYALNHQEQFKMMKPIAKQANLVK
jgi:hypothetical protein